MQCLPTPKGAWDAPYACSNWVETVAFSGNNQILASGSWDGEIILWDIVRGTKLHSFNGHQEAVMGLVFFPDHQTLVSGGQDNTIRIWNFMDKSNAAARVLRGHNSTVRGVIFCNHNEYLASASQDKTIRLWNIHSMKQIATSKEQEEWLTCLAATPDGSIMATGDLDGRVMLWKVQ